MRWTIGLIALVATKGAFALDEPPDVVFRCPGEGAGAPVYREIMDVQDAMAQKCQALGIKRISLDVAKPESAPAASQDPNTPDRLKAYALEQRSCIHRWQLEIDNQKEIAKVSGFYDKSIMYQAGIMIVGCRRKLEAVLQQCKKC